MRKIHYGRILSSLSLLKSLISFPRSTGTLELAAGSRNSLKGFNAYREERICDLCVIEDYYYYIRRQLIFVQKYLVGCSRYINGHKSSQESYLKEVGRGLEDESTPIQAKSGQKSAVSEGHLILILFLYILNLIQILKRMSRRREKKRRVNFCSCNLYFEGWYKVYLELYFSSKVCRSLLPSFISLTDTTHSK